MNEITRLMKTYKEARLIPEKELVEALKIDLADISDIKVVALPAADRLSVPKNTSAYILIAKGENIAILDIRNIEGKRTFYQYFHILPHFSPYWRLKEENDRHNILLLDCLDDIRFFLINGQPNDEKKYILEGAELIDPELDDNFTCLLVRSFERRFEIKVKADFFPKGGCMDLNRQATIIGDEKGIFANGDEAIMMFSGCQLRFTLKSNGSCFITFDNMFSDGTTIEGIYKQLKPFIRLEKLLK